MSGQREAVARWLCSNMHRHGVAPSACEVAPGQADAVLAHLAAAPVATDRDALAALVEAAVRRRVDDWFASSAEVYTSGNAVSWRRGLVGYVTRGPGSVTDALAPHIAAVTAAAREAALAGVRARIEAVLRQFTHDAECRHAQGFDVPCDCYMSDLMPDLRAALADAGHAAPPADEVTGTATRPWFSGYKP